ncbi:ribosome recycling factor, partial [bacterium]|nr:ribosome recycling factor [bacterium]
KKLEKDGDIGQDESRSLADQVQKATDSAVSDIDGIVAVKEQEIMQV